MIVPAEEYRRVLSTMPIVCVDCVVINGKGQYLLVRRDNEPLKGEYWVPGGRLHKGERLVDAVQRKMRQEIGVGVEIIRNLGFFEEFFDKTAENADGGVHTISMVYLVKPRNGDIRLDEQSSDWGWFDKLPERFSAYSDIKLDLARV